MAILYCQYSVYVNTSSTVNLNNHCSPMDSHSHSHSQSPLKFYFIPFLFPSHMIPLFELSRLFAARGHHVTIISTPSNVLSLQNKLNSSPLPLHFHSVPFPSKQAGLPDGFENPILASDFDSLLKFFKAFFLLQQPMEAFIDQNPPDFIVSDSLYPWTADCAIRLGIQRLVFDGLSVFAVSLMDFFLTKPDSPHRNVTSNSEPFLIPGLPHPITMTLNQLPDCVTKPDNYTLMLEKIRDAELKSYGRVVNSFAELEGDYAEHHQKIIGHKIWHIGPASLIHRTAAEKAERSMKSVVSEQECMSWLNSKQPNSVIYICFGSAYIFSDKQLYEIATGIESSGHTFIWVVCGRDESKSEEETQKWLPKGFEERMKRENKGMIMRGWAPQVLILGHQAIGGFLTHCGWNSVIEGICAGVPMITWPLTAEQFYNEKLITQVHGFGVEVGSEEWTMSAIHERKKVVSGDRVEKAVRKLMDGGEEAVEMRKRAEELGEKAKAAMEEGGSSHKNLTALIEDLKQKRAERAAILTGSGSGSI